MIDIRPMNNWNKNAMQVYVYATFLYSLTCSEIAKNYRKYCEINYYCLDIIQIFPVSF